MPKNKVIFVTATDTGVGKTITTFCLGTLLQEQGLNVGVMKPVQCAGHDAVFLKKNLGLKDELGLINPYYAPEPLSPHLAFRRAGIRVDRKHIMKALAELKMHHQIILVEGAGGLMVPIMRGYDQADLAKDLKAEIIIVARLGLGTINHTLLTINEVKRRKLKIRGLIFCESKLSKKGIPEKTNPAEIEQLSGIKVLGTIPYLKPLSKRNVLSRCQNLKI